MTENVFEEFISTLTPEEREALLSTAERHKRAARKRGRAKASKQKKRA